MTSKKLPDSVEAVFPLSPTQQGMLYHSLHSAGSGMYLGQHCLTLNNVDADLLDKAWQLVVARHSGLRSVFAWRGLSNSVQLVHASTQAQIRRVTLPESDIESWLAADAVEDFNLTDSTPSRTALITPEHQADPNNTRTLFVWTRHHLLVDGWSAHLAIGDLQSAYAALLKEATWPNELAPRFASYIGWLQNSDNEASKAHWAGVLSGSQLQAELETIKAPYNAGGGTRRVQRGVSSDLLSTLEQCRKRYGLTLSALIHGAWAAVLAALTDAESLVLGSTIAGRPADLPDSQSIVGNFINTMPVVLDLTPDQPLANWLQSMQLQIATSSAHGHVSKRDMLLAANLPPASPLFSSVVVFMNYPKVDSATGGLDIIQSRYDEHSHYPVALLVEPGKQLDLILIHHVSEVTPEVGDWLLDSVAENLARLPDALTGSTADFLNAGLTNSHGKSSNGSVSTVLTEPAIDVVRALRTTVDTCPDRCALSIGDQRLSYRQLHTMLTAVAGRFASLGVGAGSNVVVVMPRCVEAMVSIWATLSLEATYVPLATGSPMVRIEEIARDCAATLVVSNVALPEFGVQQIRFASYAEFSEEFNSEGARTIAEGRGFPPTLGAQNIAYRIHTSGSTGKAKSVPVNHFQLAHSLAARLQFYGKTSYRFALLSPLAFDSSVASIYWTAAAGGELVLVPEDVVQNPSVLSAYLKQHDVNALLTLPAVYAALLAVAPANYLDTLELVIVAGEACPADLFLTHSQNAMNTTLVNEYGPTEATVWCAAKKFPPGKELEFGTSSLPIGKSIPGVTLSVVDAANEPCPEGVIGELVVHGHIVASPNRDDGGYATGDLVQSLPNGDLVFRGRKDQQIKVRGHRVEASEVEAGIVSHPGVDACAVVARTSAPSTNISVLNAALGRLSTAHALALLQEVETKGA